ncbi:MAG: hypothetical protein KDC12_10140 [Flavobacteriales bacterium]|nr:hypothetical protein [Flavobacteriales bacterium]
MIKKLLVAALLTVGATFFAQDAAAQSQENVDISITNETTREQLWEMHESLKAQGIQFKYQPEFNQDRQLIGIQVTVTTEDGFTGSFANNNLVDGQSVRIIRNYDEGAEVPFCVGNCNPSED